MKKDVGLAAALKTGVFIYNADKTVDIWTALIKKYRSIDHPFLIFYIASHQVKQNDTNTPFTYLVHIPQEKIAEDMNISTRKVRSIISTLCEDDVLEVKRAGQPTKNHYGVVVSELTEVVRVDLHFSR